MTPQFSASALAQDQDSGKRKFVEQATTERTHSFYHLLPDAGLDKAPSQSGTEGALSDNHITCHHHTEQPLQAPSGREDELTDAGCSYNNEAEKGAASVPFSTQSGPEGALSDSHMTCDHHTEQPLQSSSGIDDELAGTGGSYDNENEKGAVSVQNHTGQDPQDLLGRNDKFDGKSQKEDESDVSPYHQISQPCQSSSGREDDSIDTSGSNDDDVEEGLSFVCNHDKDILGSNDRYDGTSPEDESDVNPHHQLEQPLQSSSCREDNSIDASGSYDDEVEKGGSSVCNHDRGQELQDILGRSDEFDGELQEDESDVSPFGSEVEDDDVCIEEELPEEIKREMLASICKGSVMLTRDFPDTGCYSHVYLVGTAHVSKESCIEVQKAIQLLRPQVVFLELCHKRSFMLGSAPLQVPTVKEMLISYKERRMNLMGILYSWLLAKVATKMDVFPGQEFRVAYEEAKSYGAEVVLGDRDVQVTLKRTWNKMNMWYKMKFVFCTIFQAISLPSVDDLKDMIQELQDNDALTLAFQELSKSFPTIMETLVHERDMFMTAVLQKLAERRSSVVAVVGKGHIPGITRNWTQDISASTLMEIPSNSSSWTKSFRLLCMAALVAIIAVTYYLVFIRQNSGNSSVVLKDGIL